MSRLLAFLSLAAFFPVISAQAPFALPYEIRNGQAIFQGDILLNPPDKAPTDGVSGSLSGSFPKPDPRPPIFRIAPTDSAARRWPGGIIYYVVDPSVAQPDKVAEAILHWQEHTPIRFVPRQEQPNYVRFIRTDSGCFSAVGMTGFEQLIQLNPGCSTTTIIHEIGHTAGLWHEQSREDRDRYLDLRLEAFTPEARAQWEAKIFNGDDRGPYDFASVMHYFVGQLDQDFLPIVETRPQGIPTNIGSGLSVGDIDGIKRLYGVTPATTTITTHPAGLPYIVDGLTYSEPQAFPWEPGSVHTIEAPAGYLDGDTLHRFARWSDEGPAVHQIQASPDVTAYTASYSLAYRAEARSADDSQGSVMIATDLEDHFATSNSIVHLEATPAPGFHFVRWVTQKSDRPLSAAPVYEPRARGPGEVYVAEFSAQPPTIITSDPPGISVSVDGFALPTPVAFAWEPGEIHTVDAAAGLRREREGYRDTFLHWSDGGAEQHSFTADGAGGVLTATFQREVQLTIGTGSRLTRLALPDGYETEADIGIPQLPGTVTIEPPSEDGFYSSGTELTLTAEANGDYEFVSWITEAEFGDGDLASPVLELTLRQPLQIAARFLVPGTVNPAGILHAAHYLFGPVAPGQIVTLFGAGLGPTPARTLELDGEGRVSTNLGGTEVHFDGIPAPIIYAADTQVSLVVPFGVSGRDHVDVVPVVNGQPAAFPAILQVEETNPGAFTYDASGRGQLAALNQDNTVNAADNPAEAGSILVFYMTGTGVTNPPSTDGAVTGQDPPALAAPLRVWIGWHQAEIVYAGAAPSLAAGVTQVNVRIPPYLSGAEIPVVIESGGIRAPNFFTIAIQ